MSDPENKAADNEAGDDSPKDDDKKDEENLGPDGGKGICFIVGQAIYDFYKMVKYAII